MSSPKVSASTPTMPSFIDVIPSRGSRGSYLLIWLDIKSFCTCACVCKSYYLAFSMFKAAREGDKQVVKLYLQHRFSLIYTLKTLAVNSADAQPQSMLDIAIEKGYVSMLRFLLKRGALNSWTIIPPITHASGIKDPEKREKVMRLLLHAGADWISTGEGDQLALDYRKSKECKKIRELIKTAQDHILKWKRDSVSSTSKTSFTTLPLNATNHLFKLLCFEDILKMTSLCKAHCVWLSDVIKESIEHDYDRIVKYTILRQPALFHLDGGGYMLDSAVRAGKPKVVRTVLKFGIDPKWFRRSLFFEALRIQKLADRIKVMKALLLHGRVDINEIEHGKTALEYAVMNGDLPLITFLLENQASVRKGKPLANAIKNLQIEIIHLLLQADPGAVNLHDDQTGMTPLMQAAVEGHVGTLNALLAYHPDLEARDKNGYTALMHAVCKQSEGVVRALLAHTPKANIKACDNHGCGLLLHYACIRFLRNEDTLRKFKESGNNFAKFLIEQGAEIHSPTCLNTSPEVRMQLWSIVPKCLELGADPNTCDRQQRTLLMHAIQAEQVDLVDQLLRHPKIEIHAADREGKTALQYAECCQEGANPTILERVKLKVAQTPVSALPRAPEPVLAPQTISTPPSSSSSKIPPGFFARFVKVWQEAKIHLVGHSVVLLSGLSMIYMASAPFMVVAGAMASVCAAIKLYSICKQS